MIDSYRIDFIISVYTSKLEPYYSYEGMSKTLNIMFNKFAELRSGISAEIIQAMSLRALYAYKLGYLAFPYEEEAIYPIANISIDDELKSDYRTNNHSLLLKVNNFVLNDRSENKMTYKYNADSYNFEEIIKNQSFNWRTPVSPELLKKYSSFDNRFSELY